jgi:short-subunit dehydrogenase
LEGKGLGFSLRALCWVHYHTTMSIIDSFFQGKSVLITGASSGIGEELALQLAQAGARLTLTARRRKLLDGLAGEISSKGKPAPLVLVADVTHDGDLERAVSETLAAYGRLDVVIANAGFAVGGPIKKLSLDDYRRQFETNVFGVLRTIFASLPALEKSRGNLAIVGSVTGWHANPRGSPYAMSKFALRALANSVTPELRLSGVKVTLISPGFVASNIRRVDNRGEFHADAKDRVPTWLVVPTGKACREILRAIARGQREAIITGHGKILVALERLTPWLLRIRGGRAASRERQPTEPASS